jgi:alcohol dehydrogenase/L-iditol 2-dehydrogenase
MALALDRRGVTVHVSDVNAERTAFAQTALGATPLADEDERDFELVVDTSGVPAAMEHALRRCAIGATLVELGLEKRPFELSAETLVRRQLVLRGSLTYDHPDDFRWSTALLNAKEVSPGRVVSDEFALADAQGAFESSPTSRGKTWIRMPAGA